MEIAIHQQEIGWQLYVEGITWAAITEYFLEDKVNVFLLVFLTGDNYTSYDSRVEQNDESLIFCKQSIGVRKLVTRLEEIGLDHPYEVRLGNEYFIINKLFTDAFLLTFYNEADALKFVTGTGKKYYTDIKMAMETNKRFSTKGMTDDYKASLAFNDFLDKRCERWNDAIVKEFEESVKKGEVKCEGCSDEFEHLS